MRISRNQVVVLIALVVTFLFGRLSWLASAGAFENPEPTQFQQLEILWRSLQWVIPALLIGVLCSNHIASGAAWANFFAALFLLAWDYPSFIPTEAPFPHPLSLSLSLAAKVLSGIPCAMALAWLVAAASKKISVPTVLQGALLILAGLCIAWAVPKYFAHKSILAQWDAEKAEIEAANDIAAGSMRIYVHGSFAGFDVGVAAQQRELVQHLPRVDAGVGCVVEYEDVFQAQREYATRYNIAIVKYLQGLQQSKG
jgi:hypothetical protein